jgi:hypothetical protein
MNSIAWGLMAFGFVLLVVGLVRMAAPSIDNFFTSIAAGISGNVASGGNRTEGFGE